MYINLKKKHFRKHKFNLIVIEFVEAAILTIIRNYLFVAKMLSAFHICCIYSSELQICFFVEANNTNPDQTSDLGP